MQPAFDTAADVVREFWRLMATNNFHSVKSVLADTFVLEWPQSGEVIRGAENFAQMNAKYPAKGVWRFHVNRLVADGEFAVSHVQVTDGEQSGEALSFFVVKNGKIESLVEFWPEPFKPQDNRRHLVEPSASHQGSA